MFGAQFAASVSMAWNSPGHEIIALVAYEHLDEGTRAKAIELLRAHPRFQEHFQSVMPRDVSRGKVRDQDQWLFAYAATWPDRVRQSSGGVNRQDVSQYSRPYWHFIDQPIYLNDEERQQLEHNLTVNLRREAPQTDDDENMNIVQAIKNSARIVRDASAPKEKRSVHLCWMLHLVGDSHQPLHSAELFTTHRFPGGDHGGNYLEIEHQWKLHAFWDDQISGDSSREESSFRTEPFKPLRALAMDLNHNQKLADVGRKAAATLEVDKWIDESFELARQYAYTKEVLQKVAAREGHTHLGPLDLSESYKSDAEAVSEQRAIEAGYRLAGALQKALNGGN
jgi:hypothetical protein